MKLVLRYGRDGLPIEISDDLDTQVLRLNPLPPLPDERAAMEDSLRAPIGSPPLDEIARGRESACIVISDVTRPVPNEKILEPMLACLHDCGIAENKITLLVATGLHRPNEGPELEEMVGSRIKKNYRIVNHVARDRSAQTSLGEVPLNLDGASGHTASGSANNDSHSAPVSINSIYLQSDLKITTALIEPHFMAGYSGGRKLVCPGIAGAETILKFHSPPMIGHRQSRTGNTEGNPIHAMSRRVAGMAGVDFICNVTLSEERRITGVFSGALDAAHESGIAHVDRQSKVPCRPADIVVTSAAGYPLDTTLYQSVKGMLGALPAIKPGGTMILASGMSQGVGSPEFSAICGTLRDVDEFLERIYNSPVVADQWQLQEMMQVLQKCEVMVVTDGVPPEFLRGCLLTPMPSVDEALQAALKKHGNNATVTVIPEGPYVTPIAAPLEA